ncbi:hypothetical protein BASA81_000955 [Batrachochytrium salamandrivorans]|nr:hypothetical protein BASA81_012153 [Batrachochytrium salamandrivorans]KAH9261251.1 hypothetical protein BASA81_000955 [Batrachochytrium salamandrivorans]
MGCIQSEEAREQQQEELEPAPQPLQHKVIVIGNSSVGKSSLVTSVMCRPFSTEHRSTIGTAYASVEISPKDGMDPLELQVWDTAGEERFKSMTAFFYRKTQVAILVFDVQSEESLRALRVWHEDITRVSPSVKFVLVGNKTDCEHEVSEEEANAMGQELAAPVFWASAKTGEGVREVFQHAALLTLPPH